MSEITTLKKILQNNLAMIWVFSTSFSIIFCFDGCVIKHVFFLSHQFSQEFCNGQESMRVDIADNTVTVCEDPRLFLGLFPNLRTLESRGCDSSCTDETSLLVAGQSSLDIKVPLYTLW